MAKKKQTKYSFWKGTSSSNDGTTVEALRREIRQNLINKYYNIWMAKFKWSGLDEEIAEQQENFIMRKAWSDGLIAAFPIANTNTMGFTTWAPYTFNMYDIPSEVNLINLRGVSSRIIPNTPQVVGKDVVIGWFQPNHKPICAVVDYYVERMTQVEMVINTNLVLQNMPFLIGVSEDDKKAMTDVVDKILNNEIVVYAELETLGKIQAVVTQTPYIVDKLRAYEIQLEQELLTYLGIDNNGGMNNTHITMDAVNANNDLINSYKESIRGEMEK